MEFSYSPYVLPLILAAAVSGGVFIYAWQRRAVPEAAALSLMAFAITGWSLGYALEIAGTDLPTKLFWGKAQYIGITLVPLAWFMFARYYADQKNRFTTRGLLLLAAIPIVTLILAFTNDMHGLIWETVGVERSGSFSALQVTHGAGFWVYWIYSNILLLAGTFVVARSLKNSQRLYRGQLLVISIGLAAPWLGNVLYISGFSPIPHLDLTPFAFTITVTTIALGIFGYQIINISPIARDLIVDSMLDGMIVINIQGRIVYINPAAGRMIGVPTTNFYGKPLTDVLEPWPHLVAHFRDAHSVIEVHDLITVGESKAQRRYEVRISPFRDAQENLLGHIITLQMLADFDQKTIPLPRYAAREADTSPEPAPARKSKYPFVTDQLVNFITTPVKTDLKIPPDVNPKWYQARERSFTLILRLSALLGTLALVIAPSFTELDAALPFAIIMGLIWFLGLARNIDFQFRAATFLVLVYVMSVVEMYNFGFSVESFTFFMALVISASLLMGRKGGIVTLIISSATICGFAIAVGGGYYLPVNAHEGIPVPGTIQRGLTSMIVFTASAAALLASSTILMESLNKAWQMETQALNLLQQERDLLEQRVNERTHDLAQARDQALIVSNQMRKYYRAMEQSGSTIVITDVNGNIEYTNPMFERSTGYTLSEAIGKNPRILKSDAHPKEYYVNLWETISAGNVWHGEFLNKRKDGSLFWESATIAPVLDQRGAVINYVAIKEDITAQKELRDSLLLARDQALEASRLKSQLLSRVSHELRTPLGSVLGYAELLRSGAYGDINEEQSDPLGQIVDSANYLASLVNDLLDEAQIETRSLSLNMSFFNVRAILRVTSDRMAVLAKNKGLNFEVEIDPALPENLYGDEKRVQQVLGNLLSNAIKFTKSGGVGIRVFQSSSTQWAAQVWDTGAGIPKESQEEIFMPFRQLNNSITRENRGTGLGLSIVKQIVEIMGGSIQLESEVNHGCTFTATFPLVLPKEAT